MAYDAATNTTVLFGGTSASQVLNDTWSWDGSTWTALFPATSPPPLASASMAYDGIGHQLILFGGVGSDGVATNATWAWNGTTWTSLTPATSPPARYEASLVADGVTSTDILFGGLATPGSALDDTWSWDGTNWTAASPATSPPGRSGAAMTFDATRGVVVLFGGTTGSANLGDTWTYDGVVWSQHATSVAPPARSDAVFGYDSGTESSVLFGGGNGTSGATALRDTWAWTGSSWSTSLPLSLLPGLSPPARIGASMTAAPGAQRLVLFGGAGAGAAPGATMADTWKITTLVTSPPPHPPTSGGGSTTTSGGATTSTTAPPATTTTTNVPTSPPTTAPPAPLAVASRSVPRGGAVRVSGSGFDPGATVTITFRSPSVVVGTTVADAHGRFSTTVVVPTDLSEGTHHLEAAGTALKGGQAVLVAQLSITPPVSHHSWVLPALMVALTLLLAAGSGVVLAASTRWRSHQAH
jgi:hypothetical protein